MFFRAQSRKLDGESEIKISDIKDVPLPENSPEAKKRKREQEEHEMKEFLNELSATVSSDENNNSSEDNIFDPNAFVETDCAFAVGASFTQPTFTVFVVVMSYVTLSVTVFLW